MSFTEQLQEAEKVTGELIILHDLLTCSKRRNTHTHTHADTYESMHNHNKTKHAHTEIHTFKYTVRHTQEAPGGQKHTTLEKKKDGHRNGE